MGTAATHRLLLFVVSEIVATNGSDLKKCHFQFKFDINTVQCIRLFLYAPNVGFIYYLVRNLSCRSTPKRLMSVILVHSSQGHHEGMLPARYCLT